MCSRHGNESWLVNVIKKIFCFTSDTNHWLKLDFLRPQDRWVTSIGHVVHRSRGWKVPVSLASCLIFDLYMKSCSNYHGRTKLSPETTNNIGDTFWHSPGREIPVLKAGELIQALNWNIDKIWKSILINSSGYIRIPVVKSESNCGERNDHS